MFTDFCYTLLGWGALKKLSPKDSGLLTLCIFISSFYGWDFCIVKEFISELSFWVEGWLIFWNVGAWDWVEGIEGGIDVGIILSGAITGYSCLGAWI